ncbi:MAG TPA: SDR family NAD(P)-dependent oxidoreductase [Acidisarcina sp.]
MGRSPFLRATPSLPKPSSVAAAGVLLGAAAAGAGVAAATWSALRSRNRWTGKTVVITGGSRGLGFALASEFGRSGANLVLAARDGDELARARDLLLERGHISSERQVQLEVCNLASRPDAEKMIESALARWDTVDVLVNNAGIIRVGPAATQSIEDFVEAMDTNFYAMLYCTWAVLPHMIARGAGDIINVTSFGGKVAVPHMLSYSASKFAATGFSEGLHTEVKQYGIHVTTICPGLLRTGSHLNAEFKGRHADEYRWFSAGASLPFVSVDAARAARLIVGAAARRDVELIISPQAAAGVRAAALMPTTTARILRLVNWMLPKAGANPDGRVALPGRKTRAKEAPFVDRFGGAAAARYNEQARSLPDR